MSKPAGPQSSSIRPVAGSANGPSVLLSIRPTNTFVKNDMQRQFQRAFAGLAAPPGAGGAAPFMIMIVPPPPPIITGPDGAPAAPPAFGTLKLTLAPTLSVCCRDCASPSTSTTLANDGSGRIPFTGGFRFRPRIRLSPLVCA